MQSSSSICIKRSIKFLLDFFYKFCSVRCQEIILKIIDSYCENNHLQHSYYCHVLLYKTAVSNLEIKPLLIKFINLLFDFIGSKMALK